MSAAFKPITSDDTLAHAVEAYIHAKRAEELANKARIEAEDRILALVPAREEGSQTIDVAGYKLTTTGKLAYKCDDVPALAAACASLPPNWVPVKTKVELDATGCKWLRENEPDAWRTVAQFVTVKPAKTAVKVGV